VLEEADKIIGFTGSVFDAVPRSPFQPSVVNPLRKIQGADS
jgi:hypothetical protein